jgi:hypothetical protein
MNFVQKMLLNQEIKNQVYSLHLLLGRRYEPEVDVKIKQADLLFFETAKIINIAFK